MFESQWSEILISKWQDHDIPGQIDELQRIYKRWRVHCIIITVGGIGIIFSTGNPRIIALGLFLAITGMVWTVLLKIWAYVKLSNLRMIWELREQGKVHKT